MNSNRSLCVLDDRSILVEGITAVARYTYPGLVLRIGPVNPVSPKSDVAVLGGTVLSSCPLSAEFAALVGHASTIIALVDKTSITHIDDLRLAGVDVFVSVTEGLTELLRAIDQAFTGQAYVSPDARGLFERPTPSTPRVSPREREIVALYLSENDWSVDDVAAMLHISSQTVRSHLARLRSHFSAAGHRVHNRLELRQTLLGLGLLQIDELEAAPQLLAG
ncbi:helix-turn-helix transcriptional regulator [Subtercola vilae]|uniref:helix-turn-helix transcriptional regulator n=1 Tax=Subtercola vilae TaxID=2056433 RepID=UPI001375569D|nr:response regulator transcription factor [Subtercola vilae]